MRGKRTTNLIALYLHVQCLLYLPFLAKAQKKGFRGGVKSYEIHVEANTLGTNLHYKLPESKVKASSKQDWLVDNDNAEMQLAINSPVLAQVNVKHPKFSMKGEWPAYKTSFKLPEDVSVASKRHDFYRKSKHSKHLKIQPKTELFNRNISSAEQASKEQTTPYKGPISSRIAGSKVTVRQIFKQKPGRKLGQEGSSEMLNISRILLPIAGLKNIDLKNPHISKAMKGVVKHARKVVDEAKMVLSDAANFITRVRKLVKVTKDHSKRRKKKVKASAVEEEMEKTTSETLVENAAKHLASVLSQDKSRTKNGRIKSGKMHDDIKNQESLQIRLVAQKNNGKEKHNKEEQKREEQDTIIGKGVSKPSYRDPAVETGNAQQNEREPRVKRRGLPDTLESILSTINGLKKLLRYH